VQFCQVIAGFVGCDRCDREGAASAGEARRRAIEAIRRDLLMWKNSSSILAGISEPQVERVKRRRGIDGSIN
jgi:hypothetical protein